MMYGFGDDQNPYTESVDLLEDLVIEFITEMVNEIQLINCHSSSTCSKTLLLKVRYVR